MIAMLRPSPRSPDYKRPPLRQSNGFHSPPWRQDQDSQGKRKFSNLKSAFSACSYVVLFLAVFLSLVLVVVYVNCTNAIGFEIIPRSHQLCHDLYQFFQTGRFWPLTWDYKASVGAFFENVQKAISSVPDWFNSFDMVALKDYVVAAMLKLKDIIVGGPAWIHENGFSVVKLMAGLVLNWIDTLGKYLIWVVYGSLGAITSAFEWCKISATEMFNSISTNPQKN